MTAGRELVKVTDTLKRAQRRSGLLHDMSETFSAVVCPGQYKMGHSGPWNLLRSISFQLLQLSVPSQKLGARVINKPNKAMCNWGV